MSVLAATLKPILVSVIIAVLYDLFFNKAKISHPLAGLDIDKLLTKYGYPIEIHEVVTEDGYILNIHRVPHGKEKESSRKLRPPVLIVHCLTCAAIDFVSAGPNTSLATLLADNGYDVWLMNARGTTWSRKHKTLDPDKDLEFWDFSWHEIGIYDVPNTIDYILHQTKREKLYYIGMSQGVTSFAVMMSERPEYNNKIQFMSAMAPGIYLYEPKGPILRGMNVIKEIFQVQDYLGIKEQFAHHGFAAAVLRRICDKGSIFVKICIYANQMMIGFNLKEVDEDMLPVIFSNTPAGSSTRQILHYGQIIQSGNFTKFDHGKERNLKLYQQEHPPVYNVKNIKIPVAVYYSEGDWIVNPKYAKKFIKTLPNLAKEYVVPDKDFNHNDFLYAIHVRDLVYKPLLEELKKH